MKVNKLSSVICVVLFFVISVARAETESPSQHNVNSSREAWVDDFKGDYTHMELERLKQQLEKKRKVHKFLKEQAEIKQQREEEKRRVISEIQGLDTENKDLVRILERPFKQEE